MAKQLNHLLHEKVSKIPNRMYVMFTEQYAANQITDIDLFLHSTSRNSTTASLENSFLYWSGV